MPAPTAAPNLEPRDDIWPTETAPVIRQRDRNNDNDAFTTQASFWRILTCVVAKAEWTAGEANPRFVVTSLDGEDAAPQPLYEIYRARGDMENRIKECQLDLFADRTSADYSLRTGQMRLSLLLPRG